MLYVALDLAQYVIYFTRLFIRNSSRIAESRYLFVQRHSTQTGLHCLLENRGLQMELPHLKMLIVLAVE